MRFCELAEKVITENPWEDILDNGRIDPSGLLIDRDDMRTVISAILTVRTFLKEAEAAGLVECV